MKINSFTTNNFAGLKNFKRDFSRGLNLIYAPNESGKSTLIDAIFMTLFKNENISRNLKKDINFEKTYINLQISDTIDARLDFSIGESNFILEKSWGEKHSTKLILDGMTINDSKQIDKILREKLVFGESFYRSIIFNSQKEKMKLLNSFMKIRK